MANEVDELVLEYDKYKSDLAEHEKQLYLYNSKVEEYGKQIVDGIEQLKALGVDISCVTKLADESGSIDLADKEKLLQVIDEIYKLYQEQIEKGKRLLSERSV